MVAFIGWAIAVFGVLMILTTESTGALDWAILGTVLTVWGSALVALAKYKGSK